MINKDLQIQAERDAAAAYCKSEHADPLLVAYIERTLPIGPKKSSRGRPRNTMSAAEVIAKNEKVKKLRQERQNEINDVLAEIWLSAEIQWIINDIKSYMEHWPSYEVPMSYNDDEYLTPSFPQSMKDIPVPDSVDKFVKSPLLPTELVIVNLAERIGLLKKVTKGRSETWLTKP